ncbi:single-stranded DNA-binding protein [Corynebacterium pseudotuberculosis]|uniref:single-stranded DNA-binding protein n=1 Tax=Corynebacterium pseudotuberculosis TaxID=1719 RepID=UPI0003052D78|nr:single-stranded DNA-binding protein [Corynebacterium pseudotuberculosis]AFM07922.2 single-stranded DNA-binding protein [Corynebacterium pseudotuberculosis Cp162]APG82305.1 ssDNA-binding protein [Corynebacterium pseudotuberculosis]WFP66732.1 single-stranded DNA-binding protein [Corynebacterium pseudotuberculosis]
MHIQSTIVGNLTNDPTFVQFSSGGVCKFRIAASRRMRKNAMHNEDSGGESQWIDTDHNYIDVECWGQLGVNARMSLERGRPVICSGYLVTQEWSDAITGKLASKIVLKANYVGLELNRYVVSSRKSTVEDIHHVPGLSAPDNANKPPFIPDQDYSRASDYLNGDDAVKSSDELVGAATPSSHNPPF